MNAKYREDLDWMAFRYVAAELSPAENREFERRLEQDQEAREAVGRIVEVTCAVRALDEVERPRVAPARHLRPWFQRHGLQLAAGLSLALAVVFVVWSLPTGDESKLGNGSLAGVLSPDELAVVWSKARVELSVRHEGDAGGWRMAGASRK